MDSILTKERAILLIKRLGISSYIILIILVCLALWLRFPASGPIVEGGSADPFSSALRAWDLLREGISPYGNSSAEEGPIQDVRFLTSFAPGMLALIGLLSQGVPGSVGFVLGSFSIACLALCLFLAARHWTWRTWVAAVLGLGLAWSEIIRAIEQGRWEVMVLGLSVVAAVSLRRSAALSGILSGTLPWIQLPTLVLGVPLLLSLRSANRGRYSRFVGGYLGATVFWGVALPALYFPPDRALELSQSWFQAVAALPMERYLDASRDSLWSFLWRWHSEEWVLGVGAIFLGGVLIRLIQMTGSRLRASHLSPLGMIAPWLLWIHLASPLAPPEGKIALLGVPFALLVRSQLTRWQSIFRNAFLFFGVVFWLLNKPWFLRGSYSSSETWGMGTALTFFFLLAVVVDSWQKSESKNGSRPEQI